MTNEERVKESYPHMHIYRWGGYLEMEEGWIILANRNGPRVVLGAGNTRDEALADAAAKLPPVPFAPREDLNNKPIHPTCNPISEHQGESASPAQLPELWSKMYADAEMVRDKPWHWMQIPPSKILELIVDHEATLAALRSKEEELSAKEEEIGVLKLCKSAYETNLRTLQHNHDIQRREDQAYIRS